jgi:O-antigen/teichoic acid export membrane protein
MSWADSIIIGIFRSEFDVGVYNVAIKLAMVSSIVLTAVNSIVAPKLSSSFNNNKTLEFKKIVKDSTKIIFFSAFPIILFLFLFPEFLLSIFGEDFIIGKNALLILLVGQSVSVMSGSVGFILQMTGKEKIFQNILFLALLVNIGLNILLIPTYGILGAAIASTISIVFWNLTSVAYIYKEHQVLTFFNFK